MRLFAGDLCERADEINKAMQRTMPNNKFMVFQEKSNYISLRAACMIDKM